MLTIFATTLAAALKGAAAIVETKNTLPILAMVRLSASGGKLEIITTNLDVEYRQTLEADIKSDFACCVDAKRLAAMASAANANISMTLDKDILTVKSGRSRWAAPALPVDDFPVMPDETLSKPMPFTPAPIIRRLLWAASTEVSRYYLSGIFLNNEGGKAAFVTTDGHCLCVINGATKWPTKAPDVIIAPGFLKALPDEAGTLEWDDRKARFKAGDITVVGKVIDGTYPDYRRVIPNSCEPYAVDADDFIGAVRRVRIASDAQQRKLRISRKDGLLAVRIEGTSGFEGEEEVTADCADGFECGVNADYLVSMLQALEAESVTVEHPDAGTPMLFRPVSQKPDVSFLGVVMPMRI